MCWTINKNKFLSNIKEYYKIANEDITVYKIGAVIRDSFSPLYNYLDFFYEANKANERIKLVPFKDDDNMTIGRGYHSYSGKCHFLRYGYDKSLGAVGSLFLELFSEKNKLIINFNWYLIEKQIGKFIIPKGAEYFENEMGEIVSSQLIWTGDYIHLSETKKNETEPIKLSELCVGE